MGKLRTALTIAMRAGKPIRTAADIVKEGRAVWAAGRGMRTGRTAASIADDIAMNAATKPNLVRSGGSGMVPTGGNAMVRSGGGGMMPYNAGGQVVPTGGSAMVRSSGAMSPYNPGGLPTRTSRFIPPVGLIPMFTDPPVLKPTIGPLSPHNVPDPTMMPRDPMMPPMTPGFTPAAPDILPPPMIPRSPVPVTMPPPGASMAIPPNMELPDVAPLAPRIPTMPDTSMGVPDITMPGFEVAFDDLDPTPGPMNIAEPEIDYGFLEGIAPLPDPMGQHWRTPAHRTNFPTIARY